MLSLYEPGQSWPHRTPVAIKFLALIGAGFVLLIWPHWPVLIGILGLVWGLFAIAGFSPLLIWRRTWAFMFMLGLLFFLELLFGNLEQASFTALRFLALVHWALLLTLTSPFSEILATLERALYPFRRVLPTDRISLAISLTLRFIPELVRLQKEVREAQSARGLERSPLALIVPMLVRTLKEGEIIAEALDARGFELKQETDR